MTEHHRPLLARLASARVFLSMGLLALLGAACGQIGAAHERNVVATGTTLNQPVPVAATGPTGDVSQVQEPGFAGDSTKAGIKTKIITTTVTQVVPQAPQFQIHVAISNEKGPLYACPVQGEFHVGDDFGAPRYTGGYHPHGGNDMFAAEGTPIVAPFDGVAEADPNTLGGNAVIVRGDNGYVYNAHLSAYGDLGQVTAGQVVGYVGNTGDAIGTATHDHFEWHPYAGPTLPSPTNPWVSPYGYVTIDTGSTPAVDPYPYLEAACT